jgi:alpha-glucoside transport system permease protein
LTDTVQRTSPFDRPALKVLRALFVVVAVVAILWFGLGLLRDPELFGSLNPTVSKLLQATIAITLGVAGIWALFYAANVAVEALPARATNLLRPYVFVLPAVAVVGLYLIYPTAGTVVQSFTEVPEGAGPLSNYVDAFTDDEVLLAMRNNLIWLLIAPAVSVFIGLVFAALVDRVRWEGLAKAFVFMPLAVSFVGASVIWKFMYAWKPPVQEQIGVLNALWMWAGGILVSLGILEQVEPVAWLQIVPWNNLALIAIMVWLQVGFAMVVLSAAIKNVPGDLLEAARIDGASEFQAFARVTIPSIKGAILVVYTTIAIAVLKIFDIIFVTTGGNFDTSVIAVRMYQEMFRFRNFGQATTMAVILLAAVIPIMVVNIRHLRETGVGG